MHEGSGGGNLKKSNLMGDNHLNVILILPFLDVTFESLRKMTDYDYI